MSSVQKSAVQIAVGVQQHAAQRIASATAAPKSGKTAVQPSKAGAQIPKWKFEQQCGANLDPQPASKAQLGISSEMNWVTATTMNANKGNTHHNVSSAEQREFQHSVRLSQALPSQVDTKTSNGLSAAITPELRYTAEGSWHIAVKTAQVDQPLGGAGENGGAPVDTSAAETKDEQSLVVSDKQRVFQKHTLIDSFNGNLEVPYEATMRDLRIRQAKATTDRRRQLLKQLQARLATYKALADGGNTRLTIKFIRDRFNARYSPLWRAIFWNAVAGKPDEAIQAMSSKEIAIAELRPHHGITQARAQRYYSKGFRTTAHLATFNKVEQPMRLIARHAADLIEPITRDECNKWENAVRKIVKDLDIGLRYTPMGSPAHDCLFTKDMGIILSHVNPVKTGNSGLVEVEALLAVVQKLQKEDLLVHYFRVGRNGERVLLLCEPSDANGVRTPVRPISITYSFNPWYTSLLACQSASPAFFKALKQRASEMNLKLTPQGLFPTRSHKAFGAALQSSGLHYARTQKAVFKFLKLNFLKPEERSKNSYTGWLAESFTSGTK